MSRPAGVLLIPDQALYRMLLGGPGGYSPPVADECYDCDLWFDSEDNDCPECGGSSRRRRALMLLWEGDVVGPGIDILARDTGARWVEPALTVPGLFFQLLDKGAGERLRGVLVFVDRNGREVPGE